MQQGRNWTVRIEKRVKSALIYRDLTEHIYVLAAQGKGAEDFCKKNWPDWEIKEVRQENPPQGSWVLLAPDALGEVRGI